MVGILKKLESNHPDYRNGIHYVSELVLIENDFGQISS